MSSGGAVETGFRPAYVRSKSQADTGLGNCNVCFNSNNKT